MSSEKFQYPPIKQISLFNDFLGELPTLIHRHLKWLHDQNQIHNLTRVAEDKWLERHVLDSLALHFTGWRPAGKVLDLGTGGGFPGIPLAALYPDIPFVLLDSKQKVTRILDEFLQTNAALWQIETLSARSEEAARDPNHRGSYQTVITRAVAALPILIELSLPFLAIGGELVCWKSDLTELSSSSYALTELGGIISSLFRYSLPGEEKERYLIVITHRFSCPETYPRKAGIPHKRPLIGRS